MPRKFSLVIAAATVLVGCPGRTPVERRATDDRPNVVLITVDALRADHVGWSGTRGAVTPALDRLAGDSVVFLQALSSFQSTTASMPSLMSGRFPSFEGITTWRADTRYGFTDLAAADERGTRGLTRNVTTLAEILSDHGYVTAGFHTNPHLSRANHFDQGFASYEQFHEYLQEARAGRSHPLEANYPPGDVVADAVTQWIARRPRRPFLLWVHFMDPHSPYLPAPECWPATLAMGPVLLDLEVNEALYHLLYSVRGAVSAAADYRSAASFGVSKPELIERAHELYRAEVRCCDRQIGRVVEALRASGELDRTVVVLTADHGEEFGEHGHVFHEHRQPAAEELLRVPLLVRPPGGRTGGRRVDELVRAIDVVPTILDLAGIEAPGVPCDGRSLRPLLDGAADPPRTAYVSMINHGIVRDAIWKYRVDRATGGEHLYRVVDDPREMRDVAADHPEILARMRRQWRAFATALRGRSSEGAATHRGDHQ